MSNKTVLERPIKIYSVIILVLLLMVIGLATFRFGNEQEILNQISFAATISSILLAFLAIIYSYIQSNRASEQEVKLNNTLVEITNRTNELAFIKDQLINLKTLSETNFSKVEDVLDAVRNGLFDRLKTAFKSEDVQESEKITHEFEKLTIEELDKVKNEWKNKFNSNDYWYIPNNYQKTKYTAVIRYHSDKTSDEIQVILNRVDKMWPNLVQTAVIDDVNHQLILTIVPQGYDNGIDNAMDIVEKIRKEIEGVE